MQIKTKIIHSFKKSITVLIFAAFLTGIAGCGDSINALIGGMAGALGWAALQAANSDNTSQEEDKGYCENFANLSACFDASPSPDNEYWQSCAQAHAFCCDFAFGGSSLEDYQQACNAVQTLDTDFPDLAGHCEACRDVDISSSRSVMP